VTIDREVADNRRSEQRLEEQVTLFVERYAAEFDNSRPASIMICDSVDISANGVQVRMDQPLPIGSILRLCAQFSGGRDSLYLIGEVKWQREENDQYCIGFALFESEQTDIIAWKELIAGQLDG
jgi:PilZ domain